MDPGPLGVNREHEFWTPETVFRGETVFCLASGPSLTRDVVGRIEGRAAIVVNASASIAPWAAVWYFTDSNIYVERQEMAADWAGLVVTMSRRAKREMPDKVRRVQGAWMPDFPSPGSSPIRQGRSSGHTAISLAVAMGAARVVLLGYDMRVVDGREHHHADYDGRTRDTMVYQNEFLPAFAGWNTAALDRGVTVLNATPGSALTEFPMVDLDEVLRCDRS
ncbi:MAG: hypothetical protein KF723_22145 [Rhizobiaceae bacterium]|nr:hypothetical protein [Rhizobiaceae bacterium]